MSNKNYESNKNGQTKNNVENSFINSGSGDQIGNVINTGRIDNLTQHININKRELYDNGKIAKEKLVNMKTLSISAIITTIATITTLYLNIKKIFIDGIITDSGQVKNLSALSNAMIVFCIISTMLILLRFELKRKCIIRIKFYFIDITLVNIDNGIYKIKIKEPCPKCKTKPRGKLRFHQDADGKFYVKCTKYSEHIFELDYTQF